MIEPNMLKLIDTSSKRSLRADWHIHHISQHMGQLEDIWTMGLIGSSFQKVTSKLGMNNIYSPTWGGVLENLCDYLTYRNQCTTLKILVK